MFSLGITSVGFTDLIIDEDDINQNQLPRGGIIVSAASTPGRGYAPFNGASVKVNVNTAGTITEIVGVSLQVSLSALKMPLMIIRLAL